MQYHSRRAIPHYTFASLAPLPGLTHAVLTRAGGVSPAPWHSLNLGWAVGDDDANVEENYRRWSAAFGLDRRQLTTTSQIHSAHILVADAEHQGGDLGRADGLITRTPGIPLVQRYADCTPILLYDPVQHACGIAHAGWQGTVRRCAEAAVQAMQQHFGSNPLDLVAGIGPAIGPCCYEVGPEVVAAVQQSQRQPDILINDAANGRAYLDLWAANARQLHDAGVQNVEVAELCTACNRHIFFSHRGDKGKSGRFAAFMLISDLRPPTSDL